ncbi:MAG: MBL fold metallo-hydrolase [Gemmatimonadetes bacterium]|nr:MBL fold metallo-hydrolase [Gemmatimonadota bacterium]MBT7862933.1 MBL fold metallo-hydrolase [Gemmatimonadota bacterium]
MRFTLLGSGAVRNNPRRAGPSQIVHVGSQRLLFDCGRAACLRLAEQGEKVEEIDRLFLTHLHFDHIVDVPYFVFVGWNNSRQNQLRITGPQGTTQFVERLIRPPFEQDIDSRLGHGKSEFGLDPETIDIEERGLFYDEEGVRIHAAFTDHSKMPTLAYKVEAEGQTIVISGDGLPQDDFVDFATGADLLVYECSGTQQFLDQQPWGTWHIIPEALADLATQCGVKRLMIKHLVIEDITGDLGAVEAMGDTIRQRFNGEVFVGADGLVVDLGGA